MVHLRAPVAYSRSSRCCWREGCWRRDARTGCWRREARAGCRRRTAHAGACVVKRSLARLSIPLREPFATSGGVVASRELLLLRLEDDDGAVGYGGAAPLETYDGATLDAAIEAMRGNGGGGGDNRPGGVGGAGGPGLIRSAGP